MARQRLNAPEFAETLGKILALEHQRGYNNRAVQGGLDRFREFWQAEMAARADETSDAAFLLGQSYSEMQPERRAAWVAQWMRLIEGEAPELVASPVHQPEPRALSVPSAPTPGSPDRPSVIPESVEGRSLRRLPKPRPAFGVPPEGRSVDDPVGQLRGVDAKTSARLERLDVATVRDLLYLFPRRHEDYSSVVTVSEIVPGQECTLIATVWESRVVAQGAKGRRKDTEAVLGDETGNVRAIWFGQQYIARTLKPGARIAVSGKPEVFRGQPVFNSPAAYPRRLGGSRNPYRPLWLRSTR